MPRNMKFHAIAVSIICVVITILYLIIGPTSSKPDDGMATGDRYIQIVSASWGLNCNSYITEAMRLQQTRALSGNETPLTLVSPNNALPVLSEQCNGRLQCDIVATAEGVGSEPLRTCFKQLALSYRCFTLDRAWSLTLSQGERITLNCSASADATRK